MELTRIRACANHDMSEELYIDILQTWLTKYPRSSLASILGPMVQHFRGVSTSTLIRAMPLMHMFIQRGATSAILLTGRLELAWGHVLSNNEGLVISNRGHEASMLTVHVQAVLKVLRALKREDDGPGSYRRFPKTGHLRRRLSIPEWAIIRPVLALLTGLKPEADSGSGDRVRSTSPASTIAWSDEGWPSFARLLSDEPCDRSRSPPGAIEDIQEPCDWPSFGSLLEDVTKTRTSRRSLPSLARACAHGAEPIADDNNEQGSEQVPVATPSARTRKKTALEVRSANKQAKIPPKPKAQPQAPSKPSVDDLVFKRVCVARTSEDIPRCQVTAYVESDSGDKRIHVLTITESGWSSNFASASDKLAEFCRTPGCTKNKALSFRKSLSG